MSGIAYQTIHLHRDAPPKPATGAACNGCGVCCAVAPCPIGMLISRRRSGRCAALAWQDNPPRYLCGVVAEPAGRQRPRWAAIARCLRLLAQRSIGAGVGCDARIEVPLL